MAKVTMKLEGMSALQRAIVQQPERAKAYSSDAVAATTFAIAQRMKSTVRVDTGILRSQINAIVGRATLTSKVEISPEAYYWRFVEYGTVRSRARPFARPSAEAESNAFIQRMRLVGQKLERDWSQSGLI